MTTLPRFAALSVALFSVACGDANDRESLRHQVSVDIRVPAETGPVYITGNLPELGSWDPAGLEVPGRGTERSVSFEAPHGHALRYKITAGSWEREGRGPSNSLLPDFTAMIDGDKRLQAEIAGFRQDPRIFIEDWRGAGVEGELVYWLDVDSAFLDRPRHVVIWLPPDYRSAVDTDYRVIYVHDGQNLFDPRIAYTDIDWGIDEAMMHGVEAGEYEPAIVVGIWNTPDRLFEYSPWHDAPQYARFIVEELMPRVEAEFRVLTGPENTFAMGSSMGGLMSFFLVKEYPERFGACGCMSSHLSWSEQMIEWHMGRDPSTADARPYIYRILQGDDPMPNGARLYFDFGTEGLDAPYEGLHDSLRAWLVSNGFVLGKNLRVEKFAGAEHNDAAWRARVGEQLEWILAGASTSHEIDQPQKPDMRSISQ